MSTAGKVLSILVIFPALAWLWLASGLAELNRQFGKSVVAQEEAFSKDTAQLETTIEEVSRLKTSIDLEQRVRDSEVTVLRGELSQLLGTESVTKESLDRFGMQLQSVAASGEGAERRLQRALRDLEESKAALATATAELEKLRGDNTRDRNQLDELRSHFQQLLTENARLAESQVRADEARRRTPGASTLAR